MPDRPEFPFHKSKFMTVALYKNELHTVWLLETNQLIEATCMPSHKRHPFKNTWHPKPPHSNKEKNTKIQQQVFTKAPNEPSSFQQAQHQPLTRKTNKKFPITEFQPPTSPQQPNSNSARLTAGSPSHKIRCLSLLIFLGRGTEREPKRGALSDHVLMLWLINIG